ncbi:imidazole glycerol phosphate synthase subunit HisH [Paenibacillus xerothermodurans]|uniref:Imidazole glycerol phosphate synthase subunit HisH n=1 Tax=Paenibacillus xerothermodurans TaxID=1977292 RepID=A0A2W1NAA7_PAEXE|nr:imidazole glycerol phosphate synthase subunit HisH [Paenibacillus xerothermodurans]PZE21589.1 imidazole glycerol phosphate synthase subunit HisH [Paenibacillus xerothermodurans]
MIGIIDYGAGNLHSVVKAVNRFGVKTKIISELSEFIGIDKIIFPGVGNAKKTMELLNNIGFSISIKDYINSKVPFLGICLGMQLLLDYSDEGDTGCLGVIKGNVSPFNQNLKVPHMGWNQVKQAVTHPVFRGIPDNSDFYFIHCFYVTTQETSQAVGYTQYGREFASVIAKENVIGVQFHPEKSGEIGIALLENYCVHL